MKISRLIAFVLVAAMLLSWVVVPESHGHVHAVEADAVITVGSVSGQPGDTLQIPVRIDNNPGVVVMRVRVSFAENTPVENVKTYTNEESDNPLVDFDFTGTKFDHADFCSFLWEADNNGVGDGVIGYIELKIKDDAAPGKYEMGFIKDKSDAFNSDYDEVVLELVGGTITVLCAEHTWGAWTETAAPGCESTGTETRTCTACGAVEENTIDALGHEFTTYVSDGNAGCLTDGTKTAKCERCGATDTLTDAGSALGHSFTEYVSNGDATCEGDGTETAKCERCDVTDTRTDVDSALGHSFTEYVSDGNATCETDGTETATCDRCDATDTRTDAGSKEDVAHSFPAEYTSDGNATCTADGTKSRVCIVCGEKETVTDVGSALGHSFTEYVSNGDATCEADGTETAKCDRCDATDTRTAAGSALGHSFTEYVGNGDATCEADGTETAKCDRCDATDTRTAAGSALGHDYSGITTEYPASVGTCCSEATYYYICVNCLKPDTETYWHGAKDMNNHVGGTEVRGAVEPTEEEEGYTGDTYCLGCGNVIAKGESIPALGHTHNMVKTGIKLATCEEAGNIAYWTCTKCGKLYADIEGNKEITAADTVVEALGHSFTNYVSDGNATCEADGTETAKCDRCDKTDTRTAAGSALGHSYTAKTTDYLATEADCCHKATYYYTCANCGKQGTETFEHGEVDLTKHVGGTEVRGQKPATEEEEGYTGDTYCLGCGNIVAKGESIPVLDHTHNLVKTDAKAPTCEAAGNTAYWTCTKCGKLYADAEGKEEITAADTVVGALGHSFTNYVSDGNATCEGDGTETAKCDRCDATDTRTAAGSAKGHTWSTWVVITEATCTATGESERICEVCGETETDVLEALGHKFGEHTSDGNATCEEDGTKSTMCERCYVIDTVPDPGTALGHCFSTYVSDGNATCLTDGTETAKCDRCDETDTRTDAGSALGHSFTNYVSDGNATCEGDGTETAKCDRCDATDTRTDAGSALDHSYTAKTTDYLATEADCCHKATYYYTCAGCGKQGTETFEHGEVDLTKHVGGTEVRGQKPATEEEEGYTGDTYCLGCGNVVAKGESIPVLDHTHVLVKTDAKAPTCEAEGNTAYWTCTKCGKLYADAEGTKEITAADTVVGALGHSFTNYVSDGNATCEDDGTETAKCDRCDATDTRTAVGSALGHDWSEWTVTTAATCTEDGEEKRTCGTCGKTETNVLAALGHDMGAYVSNDDATCLTDGTETAKCSRCDESDTRTVAGSALGHSFAEYVSDGNATCEEDGTKTAVCERCDATDTVSDPGTALGHSYTNYVSDGNAACLTDGTETAKCDRCDATDTRTEAGSALGHSFTNYVSDGNATCETDGTETAKCDRCNKIHIRNVAGTALGHSYTNYVSDGNATCETDGTETAKCDRCDSTDTHTAVGSALGHSYTAKTTDYLATAADCCHKAAYYYTCAHCGENGTETFEHGEVDLTKHVGGTEDRGGVAPTEETEGYTGDTYCLGCGNVIAKGKVTPVLDHTHNLVKTDAEAPTCEAAGTIAYWTCTKCGKLYADAEGVKEITAADTVAAALGHSYTNYVSNGDATCVTDGTETAKCDRCDATDTRTAVGSALGHAWSEWDVTAATCTEDGEEKRTCAACGEIEVNVLEALGHQWTETEVIVACTCTEGGESIFTCDACGISERMATEALGHEWHETEVMVHATCDENGKSEFTCGICIEVEVKATAPLGHTYTNYVSNNDATCEADGTETAKCDSCDKTHTRVVEGSALGHNYESVVTEPTATEKGYTTHTCTVCGDSYVDSYVDPVPGEPGDPDDSNGPNTGDNAQTVLWIGMMLVSIMGAGVLLVSRKKWIA